MKMIIWLTIHKDTLLQMNTNLNTEDINEEFT